ncbi:hypothetical protein C4B68_34535 [Streptomyces dengpaensis]|uniref:Aldehyde dehydrogenase domain-containing protein n=1 Tax=Streptomyces dengpaensis TaxID=2049881 RepID=A0ABM6SZW4_9ACTN|nr:hypothetical protein C4B68_34535 [Streptomyces dengpaensis]PIB09706.1 hypothetical protein B1C81_11205 [Streptomyces sp. HG99]
MPDLFIDGSWRGALDERTREIRCPTDGSLVGVVDSGASSGPRAWRSTARPSTSGGTPTRPHRGGLPRMNPLIDPVTRRRLLPSRAGD